jgi:4'-phosphopantetheinyl transferase
MTVRWLMQGDQDVPPLVPLGEEEDGWLSPGERQRLAGLRVPRRRADFLLGRWTAKRAVAAHLGRREGLSGIEVRPAQSGAPEVFLDGAPAPVSLSISHRAGRSLCAVADAGAALGCDLEVVEARDASFVADYFTDAEQAAVVGAPAAERAALCALIWSAKEGALKALRTGLRLDTRAVEVRAPQGAGWLAAGRAGWSPISVRYQEGGEVFGGFWRADEQWILVVVANPPPELPCVIKV